jgi:hypothetical protein
MDCVSCKRRCSLSNDSLGNDKIFYYCGAIACQVYYCGRCDWNSGIGSMARNKSKKKSVHNHHCGVPKIDRYVPQPKPTGALVSSMAATGGILEHPMHFAVDDASDTSSPVEFDRSNNKDVEEDNDNNRNADEEDLELDELEEDTFRQFTDSNDATSIKTNAQIQAWESLLGKGIKMDDVEKVIISNTRNKGCEISALVRVFFARHNGRVFSKDGRKGMLSIVYYLLSQLLLSTSTQTTTQPERTRTTTAQTNDGDIRFALIQVADIAKEKKPDQGRLAKVVLNETDWNRYVHQDDRGDSNKFKPGTFFLYDSIVNHLRDQLDVRYSDFDFRHNIIDENRKAVLMNTQLVQESINKKKRVNANNGDTNNTRYIGVKLFADGFSVFSGQRHSPKSYQAIFTNLPRDIHNIFALTIKPWNIPSMFVLETFAKDITEVVEVNKIKYYIVFCGFLCDHPEANDLSDIVGMTGISCCKYCVQKSNDFLALSHSRSLNDFNTFVESFNQCTSKTDRARLKTSTGYVRINNPLRTEFVDVRVASLEGLHCILFGLYPQLITLMTADLEAKKYVAALQLANKSNPRRALIDIDKVLESSGWLRGGEIDLLRQQSLLILIKYHDAQGPVCANSDDDRFTFFLVMMKIFYLILDTEPCTKIEIVEQKEELTHLCDQAAYLANKLFTFEKKRSKRDSEGNTVETISQDNDFRLPNFHQLLHSPELLEWAGAFRFLRTDLHERFLRNFTHQMHIHGAASNSDQCGNIMINHLLRVNIGLISKPWLNGAKSKNFQWSYGGSKDVLKFTPQYQHSRLPRPHDHIPYQKLYPSCFVEIRAETDEVFANYTYPWICQVTCILPNDSSNENLGQDKVPQLKVKHLTFESMFPNKTKLKEQCGLMLYRTMHKNDFSSGRNDSTEIIYLTRVVKTVQVVIHQGKYLFNQFLL